MIQNFDHPSDKRLITGTSGTGKTTLFIHQVKQEKARLKFIFDHQGEFSAKLKVPAVHDADGLCQKTSLGGYVVFDPLVMFSGRLPEGFSFFCDFVFSVSGVLKGRKLFCCDELQKLVDNKTENPELQNILDSGRRFQIDCLFISQAPNAIHNRIRNQLTEVYTFRQSDDRAIEYLAGNGFPEDKVRSLPNFKYLRRNLNTGETNFEPAKVSAAGKADSPAPGAGSKA